MIQASAVQLVDELFPRSRRQQAVRLLYGLTGQKPPGSASRARVYASVTLPPAKGGNRAHETRHFALPKRPNGAKPLPRAPRPAGNSNRSGDVMDIKVPAMGESVTEGTLANWLVKPGQAVKQDDPIAEIETDKVAIEVPAPAAGVITEQLVKEGETVSDRQDHRAPDRRRHRLRPLRRRRQAGRIGQACRLRQAPAPPPPPRARHRQGRPVGWPHRRRSRRQPRRHPRHRQGRPRHQGRCACLCRLDAGPRRRPRAALPRSRTRRASLARAKSA